jgi:hypothetical protein
MHLNHLNHLPVRDTNLWDAHCKLASSPVCPHTHTRTLKNMHTCKTYHSEGPSLSMFVGSFPSLNSANLIGL